MWRKVRPRDETKPRAMDAAWVLDELRAHRRPDYAIYLCPFAVNRPAGPAIVRPVAAMSVGNETRGSAGWSGDAATATGADPSASGDALASVGRASARSALCEPAVDGGLKPALRETDLQVQVEGAKSVARPAGVDRPAMLGMLIEALAPLPLIEFGQPGDPLSAGKAEVFPADLAAWDAVFGAMATYARLIIAVPTGRARWLEEIAMLRRPGDAGPGSLWRTIFWLPDAESWPGPDWPAIWEHLTPEAAKIGLTFPHYTPGNWLFRFTGVGVAASFQMLSHPHPAKVMKAIETICGEMQAGG